MSASNRPVVVIGVGNTTRGDDGVGRAAIQELSNQGLSDDVDLVALDGEATRLLDVWTERELAIVIDAAVSGSTPGTIHQVEVGVDRLSGWSSNGGTHATGLTEAVALGAALDRLPRRLVLVGVEAADFTLGTGLSGTVKAVMPKVLELVRVLTTEVAGRSDQ